MKDDSADWVPDAGDYSLWFGPEERLAKAEGEFPNARISVMSKLDKELFWAEARMRELYGYWVEKDDSHQAKQARETAYLTYLRAKQAVERRDRRREEARQIRLIKAMQREGFDRATIGGVGMGLSQPEAAKEATLTPLEEWKAKRRARQA